MTTIPASAAGPSLDFTVTAAPGHPLGAAVAVMDRLYSLGGCPWDREQTHESLVHYLLEESHELTEAIEAGALHMDDVAADLVAKLVENVRTSVLEGIPCAQGALARAQKVVSRASGSGPGEAVDGSHGTSR